MKKLILCLSVFVLGATALSAQVFDFKLINKTGYDIHHVYVSPADDSDWGDDVLGVDVLTNGKNVEITFDSLYEALLLAFNIDKYDLKIVDEEGDEYEYNDLKLETINELTLTLDKKGNGLATWK